MKNWVKIVISLDPILADASSDFLVGVVGAGVEESVDDHLEKKVLTAFVEKENPTEQEITDIVKVTRQHLNSLAQLFDKDEPALTWEIIAEQDWSENWKEHFSPLAITSDLVIVPSWENYTPRPGEKTIIMDPGMAFGTGHHATTIMAVELLSEELVNAASPPTVLDVGTGTGILGIAAVHFGAEKVYGIDNDPLAVSIARQNIEDNKLSSKMTVSERGLSQLKIDFTVVVANIVHDVLMSMSEDLGNVTASHGGLILSGILRGEQVKSIVQEFGNVGFTMEKELYKDEWSALLLRRDR